jgi:hypothetical protein
MDLLAEGEVREGVNRHRDPEQILNRVSLTRAPSLRGEGTEGRASGRLCKCQPIFVARQVPDWPPGVVHVPDMSELPVTVPI